MLSGDETVCMLSFLEPKWIGIWRPLPRSRALLMHWSAICSTVKPRHRKAPASRYWLNTMSSSCSVAALATVEPSSPFAVMWKLTRPCRCAS